MEIQEFYQQQRRCKNTFNRRNGNIKEPKNTQLSENGKLFNWSGTHSVLETGEGDMRQKMMVGTNLGEEQRAADQSVLGRRTT